MKVNVVFDLGVLGDLCIEADAETTEPLQVWIGMEDITDNEPVKAFFLKEIGLARYEEAIGDAAANHEPDDHECFGEVPPIESNMLFPPDVA